MNSSLPFSLFSSRFADDDLCLDEIKKMKFPDGIHCDSCKRFTKHYRVAGRKSYACKYCRHQVYPLAGTIFEKSSTSLRIWFYALFLMTHTRAEMSARQLQRELGVTYKTAWRMYTSIYSLMEENKGDLLAEKPENNIHKWMFFNKFELKVVQKRQGSTE